MKSATEYASQIVDVITCDGRAADDDPCVDSSAFAAIIQKAQRDALLYAAEIADKRPKCTCNMGGGDHFSGCNVYLGMAALAGDAIRAEANRLKETK